MQSNDARLGIAEDADHGGIGSKTVEAIRIPEPAEPS
jgi:hypothetical protein